MPAPLNAETLARAPKVLLHDHLDGGLRPQTVLELAEEAGYRELPADDAGGARPLVPRGRRLRLPGALPGDVRAHRRGDAAARGGAPGRPRVRAGPGRRRGRLRRGADGAGAADAGMPLEAAVEAMLDGYAQGSREAAAAGRPIVVGTLLCAMRQADRWVEVAGQVVRHRGAGRRRLRPRRPGGRLPAGPHPGGDRRAGPRGRAPHDPRRRGRRGRRRSGPPWTARGPSGSVTACGSPTRCRWTARSGPVARRVLTSRCRWRWRRRRTCRPAPTLAGRAPGRPAAPGRVHRDAQHRQPADERGLGHQRAHRGGRHLRLDLGRRADGDRAGAGRRPSPTSPSGPGCWPTSSAPGTPPCARRSDLRRPGGPAGIMRVPTLLT